MTEPNNKDYQHEQIELFNRICSSSHGELVIALVALLNQCHREDLADDGIPNKGMLHTTEIYSLLSNALDPKERDIQ